ncbi:MAG TPA: hypothetical protein VKJ01_07610, partial [Candidatus Solibacter sp.]|nr:hypothetical protein [Candidatus Solibacter sp.]
MAAAAGAAAAGALSGQAIGRFACTIEQERSSSISEADLMGAMVISTGTGSVMRVMRALLILAVAGIPVAAQNPVVRLTNTTRPGSADFQIGDRFEIAIAATANQPVSVRTTMNGRTDWGPVIGWTGMDGRWSTTQQFEKGDFGDWMEVWTVGGKLAKAPVHFSVGAPCL